MISATFLPIAMTSGFELNPAREEKLESRKLKPSFIGSLMSRRPHCPTCPACGADPNRIVVEPHEMVVCPGCGLEASAHEWQTHAAAFNPEDLRSLVTFGEQANKNFHWEIQAGENAGLSMTFWSLWCASSLILAVFIEWKTFHDYGLASLLLQLSLPIPVLILGITFLHQAFARHHAKHEILLTEDTLEIRRHVLNRRKLWSFPRSRITSISRFPTRKNAGPDFEAIEIRAGKDQIRFGEHLSAGERRRLVEQMRRQVFGAPVISHDAPLRSARLPNDFSFLITHRLLHNLPFAFVIMLFGMLFLTVIVRFMKPEAVTPGGEDFFLLRAMECLMTWVGQVMRIVLIIFSLACITGGLWLLIHSLYHHLRQTVVEVTSSLVTVRQLSRGGRMLRRNEYQRNEFSIIQASTQSITGGVTLKRLQILDGETARTIVSNVRAEDAEEILRALPASNH